MDDQVCTVWVLVLGGWVACTRRAASPGGVASALGGSTSRFFADTAHCREEDIYGQVL